MAKQGKHKTRDLGTQGGLEAAKVKQPEKGGTPATGFGSAPKSGKAADTQNVGPGIGGSTPPAH